MKLFFDISNLLFISEHWAAHEMRHEISLEEEGNDLGIVHEVVDYSGRGMQG